MSNDKEYLLDGEPISWRDLIKAASEIDDEFAADCIKTTSGAATILRRAGHTVGENRAP